MSDGREHINPKALAILDRVKELLTSNGDPALEWASVVAKAAEWEMDGFNLLTPRARAMIEAVDNAMKDHCDRLCGGEECKIDEMDEDGCEGIIETDNGDMWCPLTRIRRAWEGREGEGKG